MAWNDQRPMSPHLQVYKLPLTALLSVAHRGTGVVLSVGTLFLAWILVCAANGPEGFATAQAVLSSWFGYLVLFGFTFALYLHFFNGIRHLIWDIGKGFELEQVQHSAKMAIVGTLVMTVLTWIVAFAAG